jgi:hypothetical protein
MMTCIAAVLMLVVSLSLYLYVSDVFNTFDPGAFRFALIYPVVLHFCADRLDRTHPTSLRRLRSDGGHAVTA